MVLFAAVTLFNLSIVLDRQAIDVDLTASLAAVLLAFTVEPVAAQRAERMFDAIDADGDWEITQAEFADMPKTLLVEGDLSLAEFKAFFA